MPSASIPSTVGGLVLYSCDVEEHIPLPKPKSNLGVMWILGNNCPLKENLEHQKPG